MAAYQLHLAGTADSVTGGHPGSVPDEYLSSPAPGTAIAVMELVTSGYWERVDGGYRIRDWEMIRVAMEHIEMLRHRAALREQARTRAEQDEVLRRYGWADRGTGYLHPPARGLPLQAKAASDEPPFSACVCRDRRAVPVPPGPRRARRPPGGALRSGMP